MMKELHSVPTSRGYINIEIDFEKEVICWLDDNKIFRTRQAAHQRRERLEKKEMVQVKRFGYEAINVEQLAATDLKEEASERSDAQAFRVTVLGHVEKAQALYLPSDGRLGIAWGADATWADVEDVRSGIDMWLNDPDEWKRCN